MPAGCEPYPTTASWADPDLDQAAAYLREVYERPDDSRAAGAQGATGRARAPQSRDVGARHRRTGGGHPPRASQPRRRPARARRRPRRRDRLVGPPAPVGVEQLEAVLAPLAETSTLRLSAEGRSLRRPSARRPSARCSACSGRSGSSSISFTPRSSRRCGLTAGALRTEQQARETVDTGACAS